MRPLPKLTPHRSHDRAAARGSDSPGMGVEVTFTLAIFFGIGFVLDRALGTTPWLMIAFTLLGAIGLFATFRYRYEARMSEHEAELAARRSGTPPERTASGPATNDRSAP
jgi:F0F1-type ATP synthase assembly protein I